jgi:hypothetical protein
MSHITQTLRRVATGLTLAAVLPLAAACSSGSTPTTTGTPAASTTTSIPASAGPTTSATAPGTAAGDDAAYCGALATAQTQLDQISGNISDPAALKQGLAVLERVEGAAPGEVKQAWGDFIAFIETAASGNTSAMTDAMAKMEAASTTIQKHAKSACAIELGS